MKRSYSIYLLLAGVLIAAILVFTSCSDNGDTPEPNVPNLRTMSAQEQEVITSANNFSFDLFSRINGDHPEENVFISPFSISTALSMTLNGAEGETLEAMKEALHLEGMTEQEINEAYKELMTFLLQLDNTVTLEVANSNWYRNDLTINETFESVLLDYYDAEVKATDFTDPATLDRINGWIADNTNGKITEMLDRIPPNILMYLINAIYFKADWQYQFDENETTDQPFQLADGTSVNVPTMFSEGVTIGRSHGENLQLIDIPYGNGQYSLTIVLPHASGDINETANNFTAGQLSDLLADTTQVTTRLFLPKFKVAFKKELKGALSDMGMGIAFAGGFGRLFEDHNGGQISRVIHQSFLEVNEKGSEAAAATIVEIVETAVPSAVKIDRPFLFFIREKHSGTILFNGKLMNPEV